MKFLKNMPPSGKLKRSKLFTEEVRVLQAFQLKRFDNTMKSVVTSMVSAALPLVFCRLGNNGNKPKAFRHRAD